MLGCCTAVAQSPVTDGSAAEPAADHEPQESTSGGPYPDALAGYVSDHAELLSEEREEEIEGWLWQLEEETGVEIAVVTIFSIQRYPGTANASIETFATGLFDQYGVGNLPENNGILLLVAVADRKARIELGAGYGRSRDADATRIMQDVIVPEFKRGQYEEGITEGVESVMLQFAGRRAGLNWPLIAACVAVPLVGLIAISLFRSGKRGWGWFCVGLLVILVLGTLQLIVRALRNIQENSSGSPGGFGGGFGGGFSGGGGATGSW